MRWDMEGETVEGIRTGNSYVWVLTQKTWDCIGVCKLGFGRRVDQGPPQRTIRSEVG